jgi:PAS domain S-box-containing protein
LPKNDPFFRSLSDGGELGQLIAAFAWEKTALGPILTWPQSLKTAVSVLLLSPLPIILLWGEDGVMIYNDAYSGFAGGRHPELLGCKVREGWPEVADFNDNVMKVGLAGGTLSYQDQELTLHRSGKPEQVWMDLNYSPVLDESGAPAGVMAFVTETTQKVKAERWLRHERERLRQMFEQAPGFVSMHSGPDHVFDLVNPNYMQVVGHRDVLNKPAREALPELADQGIFEVLDKAYSTGEAVSFLRLPVQLQRTPGGPLEQRYVDSVVQPVRDPSGDVIGIFSLGMDVTERVQAEEAALASEHQFRVFAEAMPNHVWTSPADGQLDWFNPKVYEYSGAKPGELDGEGWARIVHPDDLPLAAERWAKSLADGTPYETQFRLRRHDGEWRWHLARALPIRDEKGAIVRWVGTNTDIEEQKHAAAALADLNATLEQKVAERTADRDRMWRLSTDIMLVADFNAQICAVNPAWTTILGWDEKELVGRAFLDLVHPDDIAPTLAEVGKLADGATTFRFENRYRCKDGGYRVLSWTAVPDDQFIHAVGRDITADREATEALRRTELALMQAQKMETVGKLTGGVAHDFNNLLQVIAGNLQLLAKDASGNPRMEQRISNAMAGVSRGAKLASHLLAFGRRQPLEPKVVNVGRFIVGMEDMLRRSLGEAIDIETVISGGLWNTLVDPGQVENALLNLAINARDAMAGTGKLTIEVGNAYLDEAYARQHMEVTPGQYVVLAVSDTGAGMTPEVMAQVFEPFFTTKPEGKGTGLGLSMVYGFVKQSGGHVKIYSEVGQGTTVKLYLPRSMEAEEVLAPLDTGPIVGGAETILVAEDDDEVRATVVESLTDLGYRVLRASDADSAWSIIDSGIPIDLLFTDVVMPGKMRSPELARRARERLPNIAVLFTSGYTENAIVHGGRLDAGVDLIGKPYTREALARKIRHVLANQQQRNLARGLPAPAPAPTPPLLKEPKIARGPRLTVLLVEDDELIRRNTAELLQGLGHVVVDAGSAEEANTAIETAPIDVVITDVSLPGMSGEVFARRAREVRPEVGLVFATGMEMAQGSPVPDAIVLRKPYDSAGLANALADARAFCGPMAKDAGEPAAFAD